VQQKLDLFFVSAMNLFSWTDNLLFYLIAQTFSTCEAETQVPAREDDGVAEIAHAHDAVRAAVVVIVIVFILQRPEKRLSEQKIKKKQQGINLRDRCSVTKHNLN
jgi:hypothetical protein